MILIITLASCTNVQEKTTSASKDTKLPSWVCLAVNSKGQYRIQDSTGRILSRGLTEEGLGWTFDSRSIKYTFSDSITAKDAFISFTSAQDTAFHCTK